MKVFTYLVYVAFDWLLAKFNIKTIIKTKLIKLLNWLFIALIFG